MHIVNNKKEKERMSTFVTIRATARTIRFLSAIIIANFLYCVAAPGLAQQPSPVMLANVYHPGIDFAQYWVSEKYDGVRGYWDGKHLHTRGGEQVIAPSWFTAGWPAIPMDGELWAGRGNFAEAVSTVRKQMPDDAAWRHMHFMVFDLPAQPGSFDERLPVLQSAIAALGLPWVQAVRQEKIRDDRALQAKMRKVVREGGEGLMLHRGASLYRAERNDDLLKLKPYEDAEARVIGYVPGKGKYRGRVGALLVESADGRRFRLGAGLSDAQRATPPAPGLWVTYRYRGINDSGLPRFATFVRVRDDMNPPSPYSSDSVQQEAL